jgi:hypothetical protein
MFERMRKLDDEFERLRAELAEAFAGVDDVEALVDDAVTAVRHRRPRE